MEHGSLDDKKQYQDNISLNSKTPQQQPVVDDTLLPQPPKPKEKKTLSNLEIRKKKQADKKYTNPNTSQYIKDQMLKEGYVPPENESPTQMRQSKTFNNAIPGGVVQQAMLKSGYKQK